jgi:hypothetical protein
MSNWCQPLTEEEFAEIRRKYRPDFHSKDPNYYFAVPHETMLRLIETLTIATLRLGANAVPKPVPNKPLDNPPPSVILSLSNPSRNIPMANPLPLIADATKPCTLCNNLIEPGQEFFLFKNSPYCSKECIEEDAD